MSDYLWDKSGEPDSEVKRLEALLGRLRHSGRAPELPFEAGPRASAFEVERHAPARLFNASRLPRAALLAAAAALLLAVLAGTFALMRTSLKEGPRASVNNQAVERPLPNAAEEAGRREERRASEEQRAPEVAASPSNESATPENLQRGPARRDEVVAGKSPSKPQRREPAPREAAAFEPARREIKPAVARVGVYEGGEPDLQARVRAKEQLVYALRLTSEAFKEVRGRAAGVEVRPNAFDGQRPQR